jgi:predicted amidohydrolase
MVKTAIVQMDIHLGKPLLNKERILAYAERTASELLVFPECANSGYSFTSRKDAMPHAESVPGPFTDALLAVAREKGRSIAVGILEKDGAELRNTAVLVTPRGKLHIYRKTHLPHLGVDRFVVPGIRLPLFETAFGAVGMIICYEWRFPEVARSLSLQGADLLIGLSNWPQGAIVTPTLLLPARAAENHVWVVSANRIGVEKDSEFIGKSMIIDPGGEIVASPQARREEVVSADLDLSLSKVKSFIRKPEEYEIDLFKDRCPNLYGAITCEDNHD